jgi:hypothetical protein
MATSQVLAASNGAVSSAVARIRPYLMSSTPQEIALARSAAPPSISARATVLVLGTHGYVTAVKGTNGFVCVVERSWANTPSVKSTEFWNSKFRAPYCYNALGAQSMLPRYLLKTRSVLAGASRREIDLRAKAAWAAGTFVQPMPGAMCYMMSDRGRLNRGGPWHPHLMFYFPRTQEPDWGANSRGSPVYANQREHTTVFFVLVPAWSDGTPASRLR